MEFNPFAEIPQALKKPGYHKLSGGFVYPESEVVHFCGGNPIWYPHPVFHRDLKMEVDHIASTVIGHRPLYGRYHP